MAKEFTDKNFNEVVLKSDKLTVVDFWAIWCNPCRIIGPIIDELSIENEDVNIGKIDVDSNTEIAAKYGIRNIPSILFIKNGEIVDKMTGVQTKSILQDKIDRLK